MLLLICLSPRKSKTTSSFTSAVCSSWMIARTLLLNISTLLRVSLTQKGIFKVKATAGDIHLGGEDFDNRLVKSKKGLKFLKLYWLSCYRSFFKSSFPLSSSHCLQACQVPPPFVNDKMSSNNAIHVVWALGMFLGGWHQENRPKWCICCRFGLRYVFCFWFLIFFQTN